MCNKPVVWYIEPIGDFTNKALVSVLSDDKCLKGVKCGDGVCRNFWEVTFDEIKHFEQSRKIESLSFSVWHKNSQSGQIELWRSDYSYNHPKPSRLLRSSLTDGNGNPVKFPRKLRKPRSYSQS
jgi:hypothetical protein